MISKVIIVTGASAGIGIAIAEHLIAASHKVVLVARRSEPLRQLKIAHPDQVEFLAGDLTDYKLAQMVTQLAIDKFGRIDGLIINHGVLNPMARLADTDVEEWVSHYKTNVFSGVAMVRQNHTVIASFQELTYGRSNMQSRSYGRLRAVLSGHHPAQQEKPTRRGVPTVHRRLHFIQWQPTWQLKSLIFAVSASYLGGAIPICKK